MFINNDLSINNIKEKWFIVLSYMIRHYIQGWQMMPLVRNLFQLWKSNSQLVYIGWDRQIEISHCTHPIFYRSTNLCTLNKHKPSPFSMFIYNITVLNFWVTFHLIPTNFFPHALRQSLDIYILCNGFL